eukprot:2778215-Alexandrium_andersonii.AAC.1
MCIRDRPGRQDAWEKCDWERMSTTHFGRQMLVRGGDAAETQPRRSPTWRPLAQFCDWQESDKQHQ